GGYYIRAIRWHYLLKHIKPIEPQALFPYLVMGFMFNNVLPARAGEFIRAYMTGTKKGVSRSSTFATVVIERVFDGLVMICFFIAGYSAFHFLSAQVSVPPIKIAGFSLGIKDAVLGFAVIGCAVFAGIFVFMLLLIYRREKTSAFIHGILRRFPAAISGKANKLTDTFINGLGVLGNAGDVARVFLLSASAWTVEVVTYWLMAKAMGISVSFILVCLIMAVSNFAIMAPSTSGGVGPFEFFGVAIMLLFGFVKEEAAAYVFMVHAMILLPIILLGAVFMLKEGINFTKIIKEKEKEEDVK
ncbi:MAG TPA: lysylphosphatidylglycerol synthase transmembrane domain-containing protein, partial [Candidatus Goldiibacteriota bacterium]|nr:lysylphosphatidylglycerol synthase transmembrane domain-containing protein [Candidatus Goldiibacteriota bacterium]